MSRRCLPLVLPRGARDLAVVLALLAGAALPVPTAAQGTPEQREACSGDALRLCISSIPDVGKTTACMKAHVADLSPRCRAVFAAASPVPSAATGKEKIAKAPAAERPGSVPNVAPRPAPGVAARLAPRVAPKPAPEPVKAARARPEPIERRARVARLAEPRRNRPTEIFVPAPRAPSPRASVGETEAPTALPSAAPAVVALPPGGPVGPGLSRPRDLVLLCREGLIDSFTCGNTIPALGLGE